jgi:hypothetical protein
MIAPPGVYSANLPTIVAGEAGRIAITFAGSTDKDEKNDRRPWNAYVVMSTNALDADPLFLSTIANRTGDPIHRGATCVGRCGGMFDFLDIQLSPADGTIWATTSDSCTAKAKCNERYDATAKEMPTQTATDRRGVAIHQVDGPKLVGPLPVATPTGVAVPKLPAPLAPAAQAQGGANEPSTAVVDRTGPLVKAFSISRKALRIKRTKRGKPAPAVARFRYELDEPATVSLRIKRVGRGKKISGTLGSSAGAGRNALAFTGKLGKRTLPRGSYRVTLVAVDAAGNRSAPRTIGFRVR